MAKESEIKILGYEMLEKKVKKSGNSGRVYVPVEWIGKNVKIILVDEPDDKPAAAPKHSEQKDDEEGN